MNTSLTWRGGVEESVGGEKGGVYTGWETGVAYLN